jgi:PAS domain S-box-containing protein
LKSFDDIFSTHIRPIISRYKTFAGQAIGGNIGYEAKDMAYWQKKLFVNLITYALPVSLLAVIPIVLVAYQQGYFFVPAMALTALLSIAAVTFSKRVALRRKKAFLVIALYFVAVSLTAAFGSFGIGSIYLLALSVFITLQFPAKIAYRTVIINCFIYAAFAFIIYFRLFHSPLVGRYSTLVWIAYSLNFLFLNLAVIFQMTQIINGIKTTFFQEQRLLKKLRTEINEKAARNQVLHESEAHYKTLFLQNPSPMWIFDIDTLRFLQVNEAAISKYGYQREEFLLMTIKDIRPKDKLDELAIFLSRTDTTPDAKVVHTAHVHKSGQIFYAEVRCNTIPYQGKEARLVIARNITAQIEYTQAIEKQNAKLRDIAYMQSHIVRAPLARILGLTDLILHENAANNQTELVEYLDISVKELDEVIKSIINNSQEIFPQLDPGTEMLPTG